MGCGSKMIITLIATIKIFIMVPAARPVFAMQYTINGAITRVIGSPRIIATIVRIQIV
jgi:hypothetical protein